jgi:hypothetical protein
MASLVAGTIGGLSWTFFGSTPTLFGASIFMTIGLIIFVTGHHKKASTYVIAEQAL